VTSNRKSPRFDLADQAESPAGRKACCRWRPATKKSFGGREMTYLASGGVAPEILRPCSGSPAPWQLAVDILKRPWHKRALEARAQTGKSLTMLSEAPFPPQSEAPASPRGRKRPVVRRFEQKKSRLQRRAPELNSPVGSPMPFWHKSRSYRPAAAQC